MNPNPDAIVFQRPIAEHSREHIAEYAGRLCAFVNSRLSNELLAPLEVPSAVAIAQLSTHTITEQSLGSMRDLLLRTRRTINRPVYVPAVAEEYCPGKPDFITEKTHLGFSLGRSLGDRALVGLSKRRAQTFHKLHFVSPDVPLAGMVACLDIDAVDTTKILTSSQDFISRQRMKSVLLDPIEVVHPQPRRIMKVA